MHQSKESVCCSSSTKKSEYNDDYADIHTHIFFIPQFDTPQFEYNCRYIYICTYIERFMDIYIYLHMHMYLLCSKQFSNKSIRIFANVHKQQWIFIYRYQWYSLNEIRRLSSYLQECICYVVFKFVTTLFENINT